jgi:uncharacterized protein (TIGR02145 family)
MKRAYTFVLSFLFISLIISSCKKESKTEKVIEYGTVTDVQGNTYKTVKIGEQWWMAENLRVTVFNDSALITSIPSNAADTIWANTLKPAFCIVDSSFGGLYNWYTISSLKNIAPKGWHIPSDEEWKKLENAVGMSNSESCNTAWRGSNEAEKLMVNSSIGWQTPIVAYGSNESGFSALPGGCRLFSGKVNAEKNTAFWWTSTEFNNEAWYRYIDGQQRKIFRQHTYKNYGFSIRCVKD